MFKRKPLHRLVEEADGGAHGLRRALGAMNLVSLGVGVIVGAGIFVVTGTAAAQYAGPGIVLSFILSAVACAFAGLCYAEFASMIPIAGSAYTYADATLGEIVAWIIGWDLILEYLFGASAVAVLRYRHPEAPRAFRCPWCPWCRSWARCSRSCKWSACPKARGSGCSSGWPPGWRSTSPTAAGTAGCCTTPRRGRPGRR